MFPNLKICCQRKLLENEMVFLKDMVDEKKLEG
jgi:hypothetical protein